MNKLEQIQAEGLYEKAVSGLREYLFFLVHVNHFGGSMDVLRGLEFLFLGSVNIPHNEQPKEDRSDSKTRIAGSCFNPYTPIKFPHPEDYRHEPMPDEQPKKEGS